jgi:BolA protein
MLSRKHRIEELLAREFVPTHLEIEDESSQHHVPKNAETHYKIIMASPLFSNLTLIKRHKLINTLLKDEFTAGMHALSMHLYSPDEWVNKNQAPLKSPACKDGYKNQ